MGKMSPGLTYTDAELAAWRDREANGYTVPTHAGGDWASVISRSNDIFNGVVDDYKTDLLTDAWTNSKMTYTPSAALRFLITGEADYGLLAKDRLLTQIRMPLADWSQYSTAKHLDTDIWFSGNWYTRLFYIFDYTKSLLTQAEKTELETWFMEGATFYKDCLQNHYVTEFPNRALEDYTVTGNFAASGAMRDINTPSSYTHEEPEPLAVNRKNRFSYLSNEYRNSMAHVAMGMSMWANYSNDATLLLHTKIFFEEVIKYSIFPDCTGNEYHRNGNYGIQSTGTAWYHPIMVEFLVWHADLRRRAGDDSFYEYETTEGLWGTEVGGNNGVGKGTKSIRNIIETMYENHTQSYVRHSTTPADTGKTVLDSFRGTDYRLPEVSLSLANLYYKEWKIRKMYLNQVGEPYIAGMGLSSYAGLAWGGNLGQLAATPFMWYEMEEFIYSETDAGADQSIYLPLTSTIISGSVVQGTGTITSTVWTQISGPNTAGLSGDSTMTLTASGLIEGTYVFRLTITDDSPSSSYDDVTIVVNPITSPTVNAGNDQYVNLPLVDYEIVGSAVANSGSLTSTIWTKISGPTVTMSGETTTTLTLNDLQLGTYVFRLTATSDVPLVSYDEIEIEVHDEIMYFGVRSNINL
jgi:hypothetical protein